MQELRRRVTARRRGRGGAPTRRRRAGLVLAAVVVAVGVLIPGAQVRGEGGAVRMPGARSSVRVGTGDTRAGVPVAIAQEPVAAAQGAPADSGRGFSHRLHRSVECTSCHVSGSSHGALKVRTREDCMACHHSAAKATGCTSCHQAAALPGPSERQVQVRTSVTPGVSTRTLPFAHAFHVSVACADCHEGGPEHRAVKDCTGCHERHHTAARDCQRCHGAEDVKGHPASAHDGCAGGGCHSDPAVTALSWSRTVCISCHQDKAKHQAGRDCAACHQVPALNANHKELAR